MENEGTQGGAHAQPQPPQHFGPAKGEFSEKTTDHASGWHEAVETPAGARVPRLRPVAEHERAPLAERFRRRVREAAAEAGESAEGR